MVNASNTPTFGAFYFHHLKQKIMFENKIKFTEDELRVFELLKEDGIFYDAGNREHKKHKSAIGDLFIKGFVDRGKKALNHFVLSELAKKAINYNEFVELFKPETT